MRRIKYCIPEDSMNPKKEAFHIERDSNLNLITNIGDGQVINFKFDGYTKTKGLIKPLANNCCAYCGDRIANNTVTVEHFRPKKSLRYRKNEFIIKNGEYQATNTLMEKSKYGYFLWGSHYKNLQPVFFEFAWIKNNLNERIEYVIETMRGVYEKHIQIRGVIFIKWNYKIISFIKRYLFA